jgi:hypothetical protein
VNFESEFVTGHPGHSEVRQDQVEFVRLDLVEGFGCVFGQLNAVPHSFEESAHQIPNRLLVVDDENPFPRNPLACSALSRRRGDRGVSLFS